MRQAVDRKISNLVNVISDGRASSAILTKLKELEATQIALGELEAPAPAPSKENKSSVGMAARYAARIAELRPTRLSVDP